MLIIGSITVGLSLFCYCACCISSKCSKEEEKRQIENIIDSINQK